VADLHVIKAVGLVTWDILITGIVRCCGDRMNVVVVVDVVVVVVVVADIGAPVAIETRNITAADRRLHCKCAEFKTS